MIRTQIQLTEQQARALRRVAAARGVSMAAVIREAVEAAVATPSRATRDRARAAVGRFASGPSRTSTEHDQELERAYSE